MAILTSQLRRTQSRRQPRPEFEGPLTGVEHTMRGIRRGLRLTFDVDEEAAGVRRERSYVLDFSGREVDRMLSALQDQLEAAQGDPATPGLGPAGSTIGGAGDRRSSER